MAGGPLAPWTPIALVCVLGSTCTGIVLVVILGGLLSEELASWAAGSYMVTVLLLCAAMLLLWPSATEMEASGVMAYEDCTVWMPWAKVLGFLFFVGWLPVLLADRAVDYHIIPASTRVSVWLKHILMFLLDLSAFAVWEGATEHAGIAGNQPISGAPIASRAATLFLWSTVVALLLVYNFTEWLPGADASVQEGLGSQYGTVYQVMVAVWLLSYLRVLATPPGGRLDCYETLSKLPGRDVFYCEVCKDKRPHRCHHCNKCGQCVLRMDHHCPWLRQCIGFRNYKYFFVFIVYSAVVLVFKAVTMLPYTMAVFRAGAPFGTCFCLAFAETVVSFLALVVVAFLGFHIYLICNGMTTLEFLAKGGRKTMRRYDYDQGLLRNFQAALGTNPLTWLIPAFPPLGDGASFSHTTILQEPAPRANPSMPKLPMSPEDPSHRNGSYKPLGQEDLVASIAYTGDAGQTTRGVMAQLSRQISRGLSNRLQKTMVQGVDESDDEGEQPHAGDALSQEELQLTRPKLTLIQV